MYKKITATIFTAAVLATFAGACAHAVTNTAAQPTNQTGQALEIAPPLINVSGDPGQTIKTEISLRDVSANSLKVTAQLNDFTANGEDGTPKILLDQTEPTPYSIINWVDPIPALILKSKQIQKVPLTIKIPKTAAPGGYYGVVRFTATAPDMEGGSGVSLSASLGTLVLLRVKGDAKEQMSLEDFYTAGSDNKKSSLFEGAPINFLVRLKNTGNVYEQPTGRIVVSDLFGNDVAVANVNLEKRNILPSTTRKFDKDQDKGLTLDSANLGQRFLFGLYRAKLTMNYGNNQTLTSSISFWVIPYKLILLVIALIVAAIIGIRIFLRRYTDRAVGRSRGKSRRR